MFLSILTLQLSELCIISRDLNAGEWPVLRLGCLQQYSKIQHDVPAYDVRTCWYKKKCTP
eukprot:scaffold33047_cov61-Attheya_sp.AAC.5